jgi:hypothetical protein
MFQSDSRQDGIYLFDGTTEQSGDTNTQSSGSEILLLLHPALVTHGFWGPSGKADYLFNGITLAKW